MKNRRTTLRSLHNNKGRNPRGDIYPLGFRFFYLPHPLERDHLAPASLRRVGRLGVRFSRGCFHKAADLLRRTSLHLAGDMRIGVQGEPRRCNGPAYWRASLHPHRWREPWWRRCASDRGSAHAP